MKCTLFVTNSKHISLVQVFTRAHAVNLFQTRASCAARAANQLSLHGTEVQHDLSANGHVIWFLAGHVVSHLLDGKQVHLAAWLSREAMPVASASFCSAGGDLEAATSSDSGLIADEKQKYTETERELPGMAALLPSRSPSCEGRCPNIT